MADPQVSVVIPCHTLERTQHLTRAVASALAQHPAPAEVVVSVDHNDALADFARSTLTGVTVVTNEYARGVSGNRNTGVAHTGTPLVALLDDDAYAHPGWLAGLVGPFEDLRVIGSGGAIVPIWESPRPSWFPDEFLWAVGGSYTGMPTMTARVRNVWSASMAVRRTAFEAVGGFRVGFGKVGDRARPEDTDLCLRMSKATGGTWMYVPQSRIDHPVPTARTTLRFFLGRCFNEGRGKVEMGRLNDGRESLDSERDYLRKTLPKAVGRGVAATLRGQGAANAGRAVAVLAGMCAAAAGGAVETLRPHRPADPSVAPDLPVAPGLPAASDLSAAPDLPAGSDFPAAPSLPAENASVGERA
ncbi:glycosyltransferase [Rugosimonospora africana]|uniref:glycosyltransferase n=1 Tax=Rugosimonospora africana TaxID=556532 RepID=UPI0019428B68|nr:glycosyltransferase [Rugosimonospora africana]